MKGSTRRCRFCGIYQHQDEVIKIPAVPSEHPGKGYRKDATWAWCCQKCLEKANDEVVIVRRAA